jgi:hypothetical protein
MDRTPETGARMAARVWSAGTAMMSTASRGVPILLAGLDPSAPVLAALGDSSAQLCFAPELSPPAPDTMLRLETAAGDPVNNARLLAACWHRPPYSLAIRLVRYGPGSSVREVIDQAIVGTRDTRAGFQTTVERASAMLVNDFLLGRSRGFSGQVASSLPAEGFARFLKNGHLRHAWERADQKFRVERWSIASTPVPLAEILRTGLLEPLTWHDHPNRSTYLADPFPWPGTGLLLCEEMPLAGGVGTIVACEPTQDGLRPVRTVLETGRHHSYPCTFVDRDATYMLPEATDRGATTLYFLAPDGNLTPSVSIGAGLRLADPTLFRHEGRYWIAATDLDIGAHDNLCLFHADHLTGPWQPHRLWPVKRDITGSRPAGPPFVVDGQLYRPAQDCAATYGAGIALCRVDVLTPDAFRESLIRTLRPDPAGPFPDGMHTLVSDGARTWIDGKRFVLDGPTLRHKLMRRVGRRLQTQRSGQA